MEDRHDLRSDLDHEQHITLGWAALIAVMVVLWLARPIGVGILLGAFLAFMVEPMYRRIRKRYGARGGAIGTVLGTGVLVAAAIGGLGWLFVDRGTTIGAQLVDSFKPGGYGDRALHNLSDLTEHVGITQADLEHHASRAASAVGGRAAAIAEAIAATTGSALLGLFFAMLAMHYILRNWETVTARAEESFPFRPQYTAALFEEFKTTGRATLLGAIGTGLAQGVFATFGYWISGVPEPLFFGAATIVASFVPAVGTLLVIVPVTISLFLVGQPGHAVLELVWSVVLVIGMCDYVIRPRLTRGAAQVPSLVTFTALFGGLEVFGLEGLILGPVLMSLALAVLRLYAQEMRARRSTAAAP